MEAFVDAFEHGFKILDTGFQCFNANRRSLLYFWRCSNSGSLKALRSSKRDSTMTIANEEAIANTPDSNWASNPETSFADAEFSEHLKTGLDSLSAQHRSVVELTALGHSYVEIAKIVDCPVNTVKTRMFYARRQLKQILTEMHTDPVTQQNGQSI